MALPDGRRVRKWEAIKRVLGRPIPDPRTLEVCSCPCSCRRRAAGHSRGAMQLRARARARQAAIKMYNTNYAEEWSFDGLTNFFRDECTAAERAEIFTQTVRSRPEHAAPRTRGAALTAVSPSVRGAPAPAPGHGPYGAPDAGPVSAADPAPAHRAGQIDHADPRAGVDGRTGREGGRAEGWRAGGRKGGRKGARAGGKGPVLAVLCLDATR